jgi:CRP/FNR family transcriptional regulator, cyclic AMP receptor protein
MAHEGSDAAVDESKLGSVELFGDLSRGELRRLSGITDELRLPRATRLIDEGAFAHEFLLIASGSAEVRRGGEVIATLGPGDFAGEIGAMRDASRTASVIATTDLTVIVMTARDLRQVTQEMPKVAARIEAAIAARSTGAPDVPPH